MQSQGARSPIAIARCREAPLDRNSAPAYSTATMMMTRYISAVFLLA
jgi:hypothetical protein